MPAQLIKFSGGVVQSTTSATANTVAERDGNGDLAAVNMAGSTGLKSGGSLFTHVVNKTANYTAALTETVILCDATSGAITITLPPVAGVTDQVYIVKKIDSGGNTVTIDGNSSETIDGATTKVISSQWAVYRIITDGTAWFTI
jgi:pectate lyase